MGIISYQTYEQNDQHNLNILTMYLAWGGLTKNGYVKPIFPPTRESIEEAIKTRREKREDAKAQGKDVPHYFEPEESMDSEWFIWLGTIFYQYSTNSMSETRKGLLLANLSSSHLSQIPF